MYYSFLFGATFVISLQRQIICYSWKVWYLFLYSANNHLNMCELNNKKTLVMYKNQKSAAGTIYSAPLRENPKEDKKISTLASLFAKICTYFLLFRVVCELVPLWGMLGIICVLFVLKKMKARCVKDWFKLVLEETFDSFKNKDPKKELVDIGNQIMKSKPIMVVYFPIIEEILFRNTCYSTLWQIINSIVFGLLHISNISLLRPSKNICTRYLYIIVRLLFSNTLSGMVLLANYHLPLLNIAGITVHILWNYIVTRIQKYITRKKHKEQLEKRFELNVSYTDKSKTTEFAEIYHTSSFQKGTFIYVNIPGVPGRFSFFHGVLFSGDQNVQIS